MGLSPAATTSGPAVSQAATGIIDPSTGRPVGANDPYFRRGQSRTVRQGLFRRRRRRSDHLGAHRLADVDDLRSRLLRGRDDADVDAALRRRALWFRAARLAAAVRRDDRGGHADQQDGPGAAQGLRPDAGAALRDLDGVVRQWRRLLSLFLLGGARLRPHRADRYLRAGLPADGGSAALRRDAAAEEDPAHRNHRTLRVLILWTTAGSTLWGRRLLARFRAPRPVIRSPSTSSR